MDTELRQNCFEDLLPAGSIEGPYADLNRLKQGPDLYVTSLDGGTSPQHLTHGGVVPQSPSFDQLDSTPDLGSGKSMFHSGLCQTTHGAAVRVKACDLGRLGEAQPRCGTSELDEVLDIFGKVWKSKEPGDDARSGRHLEFLRQALA
ncbi:MAG: hypothetical protein ACYCU7_09220 [Acidimicrobiales bacterium]